MRIIKESIEEKGRDYIGPSYRYDYEPQYFAICDEAGEPIDVFEGTEAECIEFIEAEYGSAYSCEELTEDEYFDTIDLLDDDDEVSIKESTEQEQEDPKVIKFKEYYKNILGLPEDFELNSDNVDDWGFKRACNHLGWNYDSARANVLKETWKPFEEE